MVGPMHDAEVNIRMFLANLVNQVAVESLVEDLKASQDQLAEAHKEVMGLQGTRMLMAFDPWGGPTEPGDPTPEEQTALSQTIQLGLKASQLTAELSKIADFRQEKYGIEA